MCRFFNQICGNKLENCLKLKIENSEICENQSILFKIIQSCPYLGPPPRFSRRAAEEPAARADHVRGAWRGPRRRNTLWIRTPVQVREGNNTKVMFLSK